MCSPLPFAGKETWAQVLCLENRGFLRKWPVFQEQGKHWPSFPHIGKGRTSARKQQKGWKTEHLLEKEKTPKTSFLLHLESKPFGYFQCISPKPGSRHISPKSPGFATKARIEEPLVWWKVQSAGSGPGAAVQEVNSGPTHGWGEPRRWEGLQWDVQLGAGDAETPQGPFGCPGPALVTSLNPPGQKRPIQSFKTIHPTSPVCWHIHGCPRFWARRILTWVGDTGWGFNPFLPQSPNPKNRDNNACQSQKALIDYLLWSSRT